MGKSARLLGQEYGLTAQEMNFILKEEGFLDGKPGDYSVTEKGKKYAVEQDYHRGTGGYARYNAYWTTRTWDDAITDDLGITEDRRTEIRRAISTAKRHANESANEGSVVECDSYGSEEADRVLVAAVAAILVAASAYGIYKAVPHVRRWWSEKAVPSLKRMKNRVTGRTDKPRE